jgi:UDP-3-O-[3-hydroxymyristoyl] glucosamine N-acyltransferase
VVLVLVLRIAAVVVENFVVGNFAVVGSFVVVGNLVVETFVVVGSFAVVGNSVAVGNFVVVGSFVVVETFVVVGNFVGALVGYFQTDWQQIGNQAVVGRVSVEEQRVSESQFEYLVFAQF